VVLAGIVAGIAAAQGGPLVRIDPASSSAAPNQTVVVAVKVDNVTNLGAFELHLQFDPNVLQVTQLTHGGFTTAEYMLQSTFDNAAGTIDYSTQQVNAPGVTGSGTLLTVTFQTQNSGVSPIGFRAPQGVILGDATGAIITADSTPGSVSVTGAAATAVPATATPPVVPTATPISPQSTATVAAVLPAATATAVSLQPTATSPAPLPVLGNHTVKYGESLFCIGRAYMASPWAIAQANGIGWPYTIYPNQVLKIPNSPWVNPPYGPVCQRQFGEPVPTVTPAPQPTPAPTAAPAGCRATYVVVWGDTLYRIAFQFNSNVYQIAQANHIWNINRIFAGQSLCIP
jgi:LysM repeat protein